MDTLSSRTSKRNTSTYTIYALIDPRDDSVRYIGITKDIYSRMRQHSRCEGNNAAKNTWIEGLQKEQIMFVMHTLERTKTFQKALEREALLIRTYLDAGAPLCNLTGVQSQPTMKQKREVASVGYELQVSASDGPVPDLEIITGPMRRKYEESDDNGPFSVKEVVLFRYVMGHFWSMSSDMKSYYEKYYYSRPKKGRPDYEKHKKCWARRERWIAEYDRTTSPVNPVKIAAQQNDCENEK